MRTISGIAVGVLLVLCGVADAVAQETPTMPQPTAEHEALGMWVGSWAGEGRLAAGPYGPGGPVSWTEECSWFGGGRFNVVCRSEGTGPMGPMKGLGIMGYNAEKKVYVHFGIDSTGWMGHAEGTRSGDRWTFQSQETMGGQTFHSRFSMNAQSPTEMTFTWEMSQDGTNWNALMTGTTTKKK